MMFFLCPVGLPFEDSTVFLGICASGNFRLSHPQPVWSERYINFSLVQSFPFPQRVPITGTWDRSGQNSGDGKCQFFKSCFHSSPEQITLSFLDQSHKKKTLGERNKGKYLTFVVVDTVSRLETWPCGYSQDEIYLLLPCQLLATSGVAVRFTAAVHSHTLHVVRVHLRIPRQCLNTGLHSHAFLHSHYEHLSTTYLTRYEEELLSLSLGSDSSQPLWVIIPLQPRNRVVIFPKHYGYNHGRKSRSTSLQLSFDMA